jgi:ADP-L-glycero-D-manno-heptose 6-epimerase
MMSLLAKNWGQIAIGARVRLLKSRRNDDGDREQRRDFLYVKDCAAAMLRSWRQEAAVGISGIYNLGSGHTRSFLDLINATAAASGVKPSIECINISAEIRLSHQHIPPSEDEPAAPSR